MGSRDLLRALGVSADVKEGVARLEHGLVELRQDIDAALAAFRTKIARGPAALRQVNPAEDAHGLDPAADAVKPESNKAIGRGGPAPFTFDLASTYVCLAPSGGAVTIEADAEFWATVGQREDLVDGRLLAAFACDEDWSHWEMHPHGEEVLVLLSGEMTMVLEDGGEERTVDLTAGRACVLPRGVWHRAQVRAPSQWLAITYGRGTEHRAR